MSVIDASATLSATPFSSLPTGVAPDSRLASRCIPAGSREGWNQVLDTLIEWGTNPVALEDDGLQPPTPAAIDRACKLALACRDRGLVSPQQVLPDGDGGLAFQHGAEDWSESLNIYSDASVEWIRFKNNRVAARLSA